MCRMRPLRFGEDSVAIKGYIRGADLGRAGRRADEAVAVKVEKGMGGRVAFPPRIARGVIRRLQPVARLADAELRKALLRAGAGDLALGFPAIDGAAGPWLGRAVAVPELV